MVLKDKKVLLRDIQKRLYRETAETEWQRWAAPWEYEGQTGGFFAVGGRLWD